MAFGTIITLTTLGDQAGPFDLYSNIDGYVTPFVIGEPASSFSGSGFYTGLVPDGTIVIKVQSQGFCSNSVYLSITGLPTPSPTPTSTVTPTATTPLDCREFSVFNGEGFPVTYEYIDCITFTSIEPTVNAGETQYFCAVYGSEPFSFGSFVVTEIGSCPSGTPTPTPTSSLTATPTPTNTPGLPPSATPTPTTTVSSSNTPTPTVSLSNTPTKTPTNTPTPTETNPNLALYLAYVYDCDSCTQGSVVNVGFPIGTPVTIGQFYNEVAITGFVYQIISSTTGPAFTTCTLPGQGTCNAACSL